MTFGFWFCSVLYWVGFSSGSCTFFYFRVGDRFGSWQNLGSGSVRSGSVRVLPRRRDHDAEAKAEAEAKSSRPGPHLDISE